MVDKQLVHVDKEMASIVADNIGVNRPSGSNVSVSASYPSLSQSNTPRYAYTQKVGVLIGDGFGSEVTETLDILKQNGVFVVIISDRLGTVTGAGGRELKVDDTFITTSLYLVDSLYIVGGSSKHRAKFDSQVTEYVHTAYQHYKPIGVASTGHPYIQASQNNNLAGVVFAANNTDFGEEFVSAIAEHRFWNRT